MKKAKNDITVSKDLKPSVENFGRTQEDYIRELELSVQILQHEVEDLRGQPQPPKKALEPVKTNESKSSINFSSCKSKEEVIKLILKNFTKEYSILESCLFYYDSKKKLVPAIDQGLSSKFIEQSKHLEEQGIIDWVLEINDVEIIPNPEDKPGKATSFVLVPVTIRGLKHSVFIAKSGKNNSNHDKLKLKKLMSAIEKAAIAIDSMRGKDEIIEMNKRLAALNRQMVESSRLASIGQLAGSIARDIESPLSIIMGNINLLESEVGNPKRRLEIIKEQTEKISEINKRLADISETTQSDNMLSPVKIKELLDEVLLFSESQLQKDGITISREYEKEELTIYGYRSQLEQTFLNLLLCSKGTMPDGGKLGISIIKGRNETVQITINDNGIGFSSEQLENIFEPHYSSRQEYTGKDLYLVKNLIEQHKGSISVYSTEEKGTTYKVTFPAYERYL
jgi:signal transduction histidine kinase